MKLVSVQAPGKCILFGEHAVVYGFPAISAAIAAKSICSIEKIRKNKIIIVLKNDNKSFEFKNSSELFLRLPHEYQQLSYCFEKFRENYEVEFKNIKITLNSSLFSGSGLGSSASISVALITAVSEFYNINLGKNLISDFAFEMEKIVHGTPSGIDNTICTFGNVIYYKDREFSFIEVPVDLKILVTYSNIRHDTKKAIEQVRNLKNTDPKLTEYIFKKIGVITDVAKDTLIEGNIKKVGLLMNKNQKLLMCLKLSNQAIIEITNLARKNKAFGSKITGAGLGGCVITLGEDLVLNKINIVLNKMGYKSFLTQIDREGVIIDKKK